MSSDILRYLLYSTLCWAVLYGLYKLMIMRSGTVRQQRVFLLGSLIIGSLIPLLFYPQTQIPTLMVTLPEVWISSISPLPVATHDSFNWLNLLFGIYFFGLSGMLIRFILGLYQLHQIKRFAQKQWVEGQLVYRLPSPSVPFQFFNAVFLPLHLDPASTDFQMAFDHEQAHRRMGHSQDMLLGYFLKTAFWFQPFVHFLVKELRLVHEFEADQWAIRGRDRDQYVRFIGTFKPAPHPVLPLHSIIQGPLKTRIMQMYQPAKTLKFNHVLVVGITILALIGFTSFSNVTLPTRGDQSSSFTSSVDSTGPDQIQSSETIDEPFSLAERMPRFPGCENLGLTGRELDECAQMKMLQYVYQNIRYPEEAIKNEIEGTSVASFIIEKDGTLSNIEITRDIGGGTGEAVLKVLNQMELDGLRWIPGMQLGKEVRVAFNLPVKFKLTDDGDKRKSKKKNKTE